MRATTTPIARLERALAHGRNSYIFGVLDKSGTVLTRHASQAGRAGGSGRYVSDLLTVRGAAKPVKLMRAWPARTWGVKECQLRASEPVAHSRPESSGHADQAGSPLSWTSERERVRKAAAHKRQPQRAERAIQQQSSEYRLLGCRPSPRLLASRFASQFPDSCRRRRPVVGTFVHTLWISVWKQKE